MKNVLWGLISAIFIWMIPVLNPPIEHMNFVLLVVLIFWSLRVLAGELIKYIEDDD